MPSPTHTVVVRDEVYQELSQQYTPIGDTLQKSLQNYTETMKKIATDWMKGGAAAAEIIKLAEDITTRAITKEKKITDIMEEMKTNSANFLKAVQDADVFDYTEASPEHAFNWSF